MSDLTFSDIRYTLPEGEESKVIQIDSLKTERVTLSGISYQSSELALLLFNGFDKVNVASTLVKTFALSDLTFQDLTFSRFTRLVATGDYITDEVNPKITFSGLTFRNLVFEKYGHLISLAHQMPKVMTVEDVTVSNIRKGYFSLAAFNKENEDTPHKSEFVNFTVSDSFNEFRSLIHVYSNSILEVRDSTFKKIFSKENGAVVSADYQKAQVVIRNSTFRENSAFSGGVFSTKDWSVLECHDCTITTNYALKAGVIIAATNGYFKFYGSEITANNAQDVSITDLTDVSSPGVFSSTHIHQNLVFSKDKYLAEVESCSQLCYIPQEY